MATPIVYSSRDLGSPGRNLTGNNQNRLKQVLKACLVDGYGDKPGAGWTMVHEHENGFSMSNGFGVINFVSNTAMFGGDLGSNLIGIALAEGVNDTSNALLGAENIKSGGVVSGISNMHVLLSRPFQSELQNLNWSVYATEKTAILVYFSVYTNTGCLFYFGEYDSYLGEDNFIALGGGNLSTYNNAYSFAQGNTTLRNLSSGIVDTTYSEFFGLPYGLLKGMDTREPVAIGAVTSNYLDFSRVPVFSDGYGVVGRLYGALYSSLVYRSYHLFNNMIGSGSPFDNAAIPHDFNGELLCSTWSWLGNGLASDNAEYWS